MTIKALDHMIKEGLYEYSTDTWGSTERTLNYESMEGYNGQVDYNGEIFVVSHEKGGGAGMGGYPASVTILRIQQPAVAPEDKIKVELVESEAGWGQRIDETKEFDSMKLAKAYVDDFNNDNNEATTPEWYMYARIVD